MRFFFIFDVADTGSRNSCFVAATRRILGALVFSAMLVASAASAGATENYRGDDPDSYECSSDYNILNRFSAPPGVTPARSTKYADIKFTLETNALLVRDASNSKDLAHIIVGENTKYCVKKSVRTIQTSKEPDPDRPECNVRYYAFQMRVVIDSELPVRPFMLHPPANFDRMNHHVDVDLYRAADWRKQNSAAGCQETSGFPDLPHFRLGFLNLRTDKKSDVIITEERPYKLRKGETYSDYERRALTKAGSEFPRPK